MARWHVTARYGFRHTLYQQVLYERVPVARRLRLHRQIGARLEAGYGRRRGRGRRSWPCTLTSGTHPGQ